MALRDSLIIQPVLVSIASAAMQMAVVWKKTWDKNIITDQGVRPRVTGGALPEYPDVAVGHG